MALECNMPDENLEQPSGTGEISSNAESQFSSIDNNTQYRSETDAIIQEEFGKKEKVKKIEDELDQHERGVDLINNPSWVELEEIANNIRNNRHTSREEPQLKSNLSTNSFRRTAINIRARFEGVSDIDKFDKLANYFENTMQSEESYYRRFKTNTSEEKIQKERKIWEAKGYSVSTDLWDGYISFSARRSVPYKVRSKDIKLIGSLAKTENDVVQIMEGLKEAGFKMLPYYFQDEDKIAELKDIISMPSADVVLEIAKKIPWKHDWFKREENYGVGEVVEKSQLGLLKEWSSQFDKDPSYGKEMESVGTLATALKIGVDAKNIDDLRSILQNPEYLKAAAFVATRRISYSNSPITEIVKVLANSGIPGMTEQAKEAGISLHIPSLDSFLSHGYLSSGGSIESIVNDAKGELDASIIRDYLQDTDRQNFTKDLNAILGRTIDSKDLNEIEELYSKGPEKRMETLKAFQVLNKYGIDTLYYLRDGLVNSESLANPGFEEFIDKISIEGGIKIDKYSLDRLAKEFKSITTREDLVKENVIKLMRAIGSEKFNDANYYLLLSENPKNTDTFLKLRESGFEFTNLIRFPSITSLESITDDKNGILEKIVSEESKTLIARLKNELNWTPFVNEIDDLVVLMDDKSFLENLFEASNVNFIKSVKDKGFSLAELKPLLSLNHDQRSLLERLAKDYNYEPNVMEQNFLQQLDSVVQDPVVREKLFEQDIISFVKEFEKNSFYSFQLNDAKVLTQAPPDFISFFQEMKKNGYRPDIHEDLPLLVELSSGKQILGLLSTLNETGFTYLRGDLAAISTLIPYQDSLKQTLQDLHDTFDYQFVVSDVYDLSTILDQKMDHNKFEDLKVLYNRNLDLLGNRALHPDLIPDLLVIEKHEDVIRSLSKLSRPEFIYAYRDASLEGLIDKYGENNFLKYYELSSRIYTGYNYKRMEEYFSIQDSPFVKGLNDTIEDDVEKAKVTFDYLCYSQRLETNKLEFLVGALKNTSMQKDFSKIAEYIRWLPDASISPSDTLESLSKKYDQTHVGLRDGFNKLFPSSDEVFKSSKEKASMIARLNLINTTFGFETRVVTIEGIPLNIPTQFISEYNHLKKESSDIKFIPELASYFVREAGRRTSAYTIEDLVLSQIGDTEDKTGRRRGQYVAEQLLNVMENNVESSLLTWTTAVSYQKENPNSPLFLIANERTGPADVAAEYLPKEFAQQFNILQNIDYEKFFGWFKQNESIIADLYERFSKGENVDNEIPSEAKEFFGDAKIIPIYRLKVPSSLSSASIEPDGVFTVLNFLKLSSLLGGRTLFMDESTRSAPRSIECMYNVLDRRQDVLGGVSVRLFGKINGAIGQMNTQLSEITRESAHMEIGFLDPWHSEIKSITDDSEGFVPEISGSGIVEIIKPGYAAISPYGIGTVQDMWKQMIAHEVALRYQGFEESGGIKKTRQEFRPSVDRDEEILTQNELKDMAFSRPFKALAIDLDGTCGTRGEYSPIVLERLKGLSAQNVDVIISTARSLVENSAYDGSVKSLLDQLGELTETQKAHIFLATENAALITSLADKENNLEAHLMTKENAELVTDLIKTVNPSISAYLESSSIVLRDFNSERKDLTMDEIQRAIKEKGLPLKVVSDSERSINIRVASATKRNVLNWLESKGINVDDIAKIGDSPLGNDRSMLWGRGSFNVGTTLNEGTLWTIDMNESGGGVRETEKLLERLSFSAG